MRFFQGSRIRRLRARGSSMTLVTVVWCASCGSNQGRRLGRRRERLGTAEETTHDRVYRVRGLRGQQRRRRRRRRLAAGGWRHSHGEARERARRTTPTARTPAANCDVARGELELGVAQVALPLRRHRLSRAASRRRSSSGARRGTPDGVYLHLSLAEVRLQGLLTGSNPPAAHRSTETSGRPRTRRAAARAIR